MGYIDVDVCVQDPHRKARWHLCVRDDHDLPHLRRRRKDVADDVGDLRQGLLVLGVVRRRGEEPVGGESGSTDTRKMALVSEGTYM